MRMLVSKTKINVHPQRTNLQNNSMSGPKLTLTGMQNLISVCKTCYVAVYTKY